MDPEPVLWWRQATPKERKLVDSLELTPAQDKSMRRHWGRTGEYMTVLSGGVKKRVRTTSILNVMKDRANEMRRRMETVPLQLVDLGSIGVRWVRALPEILKHYVLKPKVEPQSGTLTPEHRGALKTLAQLLEQEDGYAIARAVKPRLVESQALTTPSTEIKRGGASGKVLSPSTRTRTPNPKPSPPNPEP